MEHILNFATIVSMTINDKERCPHIKWRRGTRYFPWQKKKPFGWWGIPSINNILTTERLYTKEELLSGVYEGVTILTNELREHRNAFYGPNVVLRMANNSELRNWFETYESAKKWAGEIAEKYMSKPVTIVNDKVIPYAPGEANI